MRLQAYVYLGWSPVLAVVSDGARRVLQVTGWLGGSGTAPATGLYVGATQYESNIANGVDISGGGGEAVVLEVPSGLINGSNATFTSAFAFVPESVQVVSNGLLLKRVDEFNTSGSVTITLVVAPITGEIVLINYIKA
jgi:hypothetical protein